MIEHFAIIGNGRDWCKWCLTDFEKREDTTLVNSYLPCPSKGVLSKLARFHYSVRLNKVFNFPFKSVWYKLFCKTLKLNRNENTVLIIYDKSRLVNDRKFLSYIKRTYKRTKLIYMFTDVVRLSGAVQNNFIQDIKKYYDYIFAFDPKDAPEYGFDYSPLLYSRNTFEVDSKKNVFYVGRAKDRLPMLLSIYEKLMKKNFACDFNIVDVSKDEMKYENFIKYNEMMKYEEVLRRIQQADILVDAIQGNSTGLTIKTCEAVVYNKKLITTNKEIIKYPFYDSKYICVVDSADDISDSFLYENRDVKFSEEGTKYFSIDNYVEKLNSMVVYE